MKKLYAIIFMVGVSNQLLAQQDAHFTQYMFNYNTFNSAVAGTEGVTKVNIAYRNQWTGYSSTVPNAQPGGAPETQFVGISAPLLVPGIGVGFQVINDRIGTMTRTDFLVSGSYQMGIGDNKLSLGIRSGFISRGFDLANLVFADPGDPVTNQLNLSEVRPELGLGVYWRAQNYFVGLSLNHILQNDFSLGSQSFRSPLAQHAYGFAGYEFEFRNAWLLTPTVLVKTDLNTYSVDLGVVANSDDQIYLGATWRESEAVNLIVGYNVLGAGSSSRSNKQWLRLSYSFDFVITERAAKQATSHEILLSYKLPNPNADDYQIERPPRFNNSGR